MRYSTPRVTILTRPDCTLCETAIALAQRIQPALGFTLETRDISNDPALRARYGLQIPVLLVDEVEAGWGQVTEEMLRAAVREQTNIEARWSRSISRILSRLVRPRQ